MRALSDPRARPLIGRSTRLAVLVGTAVLGCGALTAVGVVAAAGLPAQTSGTTGAPVTTSVGLGTISGSKTTVTPPPATSAPATSPSKAAAAPPATTARPKSASSAVATPSTAKRVATVATTTPDTVVPSTVAAEVTSTEGPTTTAVATAGASTAPATTSVVKVGDPAATRTVRGIAWTLLAMAAILAGLMVWFWRLTRPVPVALGGLAVMGTSRWRRAPRHVQDELVSSVRAEPLALGAGPTAAAASVGRAEDPVEIDVELAPIVPVTGLDAPFEWPPAASAEEFAALAPQYGWARPSRAAPPRPLPPSTGLDAEPVPEAALVVEPPVPPSSPEPAVAAVAAVHALPEATGPASLDDEPLPDLFADDASTSLTSPLPPPVPVASTGPSAPTDRAGAGNER